jgi:hypothetical protein
MLGHPQIILEKLSVLCFSLPGVLLLLEASAASARLLPRPIPTAPAASLSILPNLRFLLLAVLDDGAATVSVSGSGPS